MVDHQNPTEGEIDTIMSAADEKDIQPEHIEGGTLEQVLQKHLQGTGLEDRQTALELAMKADPGPHLTSWRYIRMWLIVLLMCMAQGDLGELAARHDRVGDVETESVTTGFDGTVIGSINTISQYQSYFNLGGEATTKAGTVFVSPPLPSQHFRTTSQLQYAGNRRRGTAFVLCSFILRP